jgi:hypothetical protein
LASGRNDRFYGVRITGRANWERPESTLLGHSAFAPGTALPAPLLSSNRRKLVFRSIPVTQVTETLHHLPATTSLIAAASWLPA